MFGNILKPSTHLKFCILNLLIWWWGASLFSYFWLCHNENLIFLKSKTAKIKFPTSTIKFRFKKFSFQKNSELSICSIDSAH